jgi:L-rhamnose mutarotase
MARIAFKMKLYKGHEVEYKKRHDELWPELKDLLKTSGISDYSIFLDKETNILFGVMNAEQTVLDKLPADPIMKKWWAYMKDIMETNADNSPISTSLEEIFFLP